MDVDLDVGVYVCVWLGEMVYVSCRDVCKGGASRACECKDVTMEEGRRDVEGRREQRGAPWVGPPGRTVAHRATIVVASNRGTRHALTTKRDLLIS